MPGNETLIKSPRAFLPMLWTATNLPPNSNQVADIAGLQPGLNQVPMARAGSVAAVLVLLSTPVTAQAITVTLRKNGSNTSNQIVVGPADGLVKVAELPLVNTAYAVGDLVGIAVSTPLGFAPAGTVDLVVYLEVQNV